MEIGSKSMTFRHRLIKSEGDTVAFETVFRCVMLNLETRRAAAIPDDVRQMAAQWSEQEA
jgi:acyl-CoA thioesterase FadM